ncbi:hypothetical protein [Poseidonocella sedimentorum]|nr:hypothetical protein [Poseidonocella sedimentorum]
MPPTGGLPGAEADPAAQAAPATPAPPATARTAEEFDTTTAEDRAAAQATTAQPADAPLGRTITSLGNPTDPGFWMETPLVDAVRSGRVRDPATGKSVAVELRPAGGAASGSRISLAAMRLLGAPLTGLPELEVFAD